jgi:hypothetical protein
MSKQFFISYLFSYLFWFGLAMGCLYAAMLERLTGGKWGFGTRRIFEAGFMTLPLLAVLFVPILFGLKEIYPWTHHAEVLANPMLQRKALYLNIPAFIGRAVIYFIIWLAMARSLRKWSLQQDANSDPHPSLRARILSGPGIVIATLIGTFAFVDWVMSLEPEWSSTIFPLIVIVGQFLTALCFGTVLAINFKQRPDFAPVATSKAFHDLGNLLLAFVMFWAYISFAQYLIIYCANVPRETSWYLHRIHGSWKWVINFLVLFHFFVPFWLLLFRGSKKNPARLRIIAGLVFGVHVLEVYWLVTPVLHPQGFHISVWDVVLFLAIGALWIFVFTRNLFRHPLLPQNNPAMESVTVPVAHAT